VYWSLVQNYFFSDDFLHLWTLVNDGLGRFLLEMHAGHLYVVRNLVFALHYWLFGMHPAPYFWTVLAVHLLNVYLLFLTARALTDSWRLGATVAALWGMAPVQEGTLGWYSVFGHALAGTCTLWVLSRLMRWRSGESPSRLAIALAALVMIAGGSCFGVGIGTALVMPAIAWLLLPAGRARTSATLALASAGAFVALEYFTVKRLNLELFGVISLTTIPALPYLW